MRFSVLYPSLQPLPGCKSCPMSAARISPAAQGRTAAPTTAGTHHRQCSSHRGHTSQRCHLPQHHGCSRRPAAATWPLRRARTRSFTLRKFTVGCEMNEYNSAATFSFCQVHGCLSHTRPALAPVTLQPGDPSFRTRSWAGHKPLLCALAVEDRSAQILLLEFFADLSCGAEL